MRFRIDQYRIGDFPTDQNQISQFWPSVGEKFFWSEPEPIGHAYHGVQRPKPSTTRSNAPMYTERVQLECQMGSSPESPLRSE
ncbi:hypothetical protein CDL15_Pgr005230 [Punica granatum]|uniref:Uncharacterized protein n=1 Tax=Punica granatum TaxID=22663 RepID=A0A218WQK8_PUNGR|nr:hypothetical protein CDL15_Pgr005230 [Punica granatum]